MDDLFCDSETLSFLVGLIAQFVGWGAGLALVFVLVGLVLWFVFDVMKGGF